MRNEHDALRYLWNWCLVALFCSGMMHHVNLSAKTPKPGEPGKTTEKGLRRDLEVEIASRPIEGLSYRYDILRMKRPRRDATHFARVSGAYRGRATLAVRFEGKLWYVRLNNGVFRFNLPLRGEKSGFIFETRSRGEVTATQGIQLLYTKLDLERAVASEYLDTSPPAFETTVELGYGVNSISATDKTNVTDATFSAPVDADVSVALWLVTAPHFQPFGKFRARFLSISKPENRALAGAGSFLWETMLGVRWRPGTSPLAFRFAVAAESQPVIVALSETDLLVSRVTLAGGLLGATHELPLGTRTALGFELDGKVSTRLSGTLASASLLESRGTVLLHVRPERSAFLGLSSYSLGVRGGYLRLTGDILSQRTVNAGLVFRGSW